MIFFCVREYDVTSQEVRKVQDITSFLLHARRGAPLAEGLGADYAMTKICEQRKVHDISSFLLRARI
jgi:hypothetical protein